MSRQAGLQIPQHGTMPQAAAPPLAMGDMPAPPPGAGGPPDDAHPDAGDGIPEQQASMSITGIMGEAQDWFKQLERSLAGFDHLNMSLASFANQLPPGSRRKGLPILSFKASPNGRDMIECAIDLKHCHPEHIKHVLIPLTNTQQHAVLVAIEELQQRINMLRAVMMPAQQ